jgi:hypothetical protein
VGGERPGTLVYRGRTWMTFRWDPAPGRRFEGTNFIETPDAPTST